MNSIECTEGWKRVSLSRAISAFLETPREKEYKVIRPIAQGVESFIFNLFKTLEVETFAIFCDMAFDQDFAPLPIVTGPGTHEMMIPQVWGPDRDINTVIVVCYQSEEQYKTLTYLHQALQERIKAGGKILYIQTISGL